MATASSTQVDETADPADGQPDGLAGTVQVPNHGRRRRPNGPLEMVLAGLSSLRLTVWLFAASIFIVFAGTLAQTQLDIWDVIDRYFRFRPSSVVDGTFPFVHVSELFVWIDAGLFFPPAFSMNPPEFPSWLGFWFPKGWTIGVVLLANLLAAHAVRYKMQAKGRRKVAGLAVTALGVALTVGVIVSSGSLSGLQQTDPTAYRTIWQAMLASMLLLGAGGIYGSVALPGHRTVERILLGVAGLGLVGLTVTLALQKDAQFSDASMRILWDLIKATVAGVVLLAGCVLLFRKRAGIVLLHEGVTLLMVGEIIVGLVAVESRMTIREGRTANYSQDIRAAELVVTESNPDGTRTEHIVPAEAVDDAAGAESIEVDGLPFVVRPLRYEPNALVRRTRKTGEGTTGYGVASKLFGVKTSDGVSMESVDQPGAVVKLIGDGFDETLVTWVNLRPQPVRVGDRRFEVGLRFARHYKPYAITLRDFSQRNYIGTSTPQDYRATIAFDDPSRGFRKESHDIWMNNPLRYAGETFYQSSLMPDGEGTVLQVVSNVGWSIPYVACMLTAVGMAAQFLLSLLRYIDRRRGGRLPEQRVADTADTDDPAFHGFQPERSSSGPLVATVIALGLAGILVLYSARPKAISDRFDRDVTAFGSLPVVEAGRVKPMSSLAINSVLGLADRQSIKVPVVDPEGGSEPKLVKVDPEAWLLDIVSGRAAADDVYAYKPSDQARGELGLSDDRLYTAGEITAAAVSSGLTVEEFDQLDATTMSAVQRELDRLLRPVLAADAVRVFRIESLEVLQTLNLTRRPGYSYSLAEIQPAIPALQRDAAAANRRDAAERTIYQRKILETAGKVLSYIRLRTAFEEPAGLPPIPPNAELDAEPEMKSLLQRLMLTRVLPGVYRDEQLQSAPLAVPNEVPANSAAASIYVTDGQRDEWLRYPDAVAANLYLRTQDELPMDAAVAFEQLRRAARNPATTSEQLTKSIENFRETVVRARPDGYDRSKLAFETHFNHFSPFWVASWLIYLPAFLAIVASWIGRPREGLSVAFALVCLGFAVHTYALVARYYISGRPPVTNLYTVAVFVGWAAALFGLLLEVIFRGGLGSLIASISGFTTLLIGNVLATDGDTFTVMQAVLDTQFWLATHVVTINLGYAATLVAALVGLIYIVRGVFTTSLDPAAAKTLTRVCYGVNCFAILFSFVGTVLGGLWADDSWGRFWGWDPKENGALMIVLWNALVLHANWGKMIGQRGLAVLSLLGAIIVSWSWFGVNELGVGLHSYGFTEGVLRNLALFCGGTLAMAAIGGLPFRFWRSGPGRDDVVNARPADLTKVIRTGEPTA